MAVQSNTLIAHTQLDHTEADFSRHRPVRRVRADLYHVPDVRLHQADVPVMVDAGHRHYVRARGHDFHGHARTGRHSCHDRVLLGGEGVAWLKSGRRDQRGDATGRSRIVHDRIDRVGTVDGGCISHIEFCFRRV